MYAIELDEIDAYSLTKEADGRAILNDIRPGYEYVDGKRTEKITHIKVEIVIPSKRYTKLVVKVKDLKQPITSEELKQLRGNKDVYVRFKNLTGSVYTNPSGDQLVSARADSVEVLA
ncbi:MAG: hypothetical protein K6A74_03885 [Lachnospiraceae bacterium]|nr:hypothetical protein [Lachnospiraceae bacterium]